MDKPLVSEQFNLESQLKITRQAMPGQLQRTYFRNSSSLSAAESSLTSCPLLTPSSNQAKNSHKATASLICSTTDHGTRYIVQSEKGEQIAETLEPFITLCTYTHTAQRLRSSQELGQSDRSLGLQS